MSSSVKYFTTQEANQTLPLVKRIVLDILKIGKEIRGISMGKVDGPVAEPELNRLMDQLDELFEELESLGCSYKDWNFSEGLVDFPAVVNGKEAFLCWRSDEPVVRYYHDLESGFAGRKLIKEE